MIEHDLIIFITKSSLIFVGKSQLLAFNFIKAE